MATLKQLAALKKARAARKKNLAKKPTARKAPAKKRTVKPRAKAKRNPVSQYVVTVSTGRANGYLSDFPLSGPKFDTDIGKAIKFPGHRAAILMQNAIYKLRPRGIKSVDVRTTGSVRGKK